MSNEPKQDAPGEQRQPGADDELRMALGFYSLHHRAVLRLIDRLQSIGNDPRSAEDQRHAVEHSVAALLDFVLKLEPRPSDVVVNALFALVAALATADEGKAVPLLEPSPPKHSGAATAIGETVWKDNAASIIEYLRANGLTVAEATRQLASELRMRGAHDSRGDRFDAERLRNFHEQQTSERRNTGYGAGAQFQTIDFRKEIKSDADADAIIAFLAANGSMVIRKARTP